MKKAAIFLNMIAVTAAICFNAASAAERSHDYIFFDNSIMPGNWCYSEVSYSGSAWVENRSKHLPVVENEYSSPGNSLKLRYISAREGDWAVDLKYAPVRGIEVFKPATCLSLRLKGTAGTATSALPKLTVYDSEGKPSRTIAIGAWSGPVTGNWQTIAIPVEEFGIEPATGSEMLSRAAALRFSKGENTNSEVLLYIDDVEFIQSTACASEPVITEIIEASGYERHIDLRWKDTDDATIKYYKIWRSFDGRDFTPVAIRRPWIDRYTDFVGEPNRKAWYRITSVAYNLSESDFSNTVEASTREMTDEQLLTMVQEASFRYYWEGAEPCSGMAREDIPGKTDMVAAGASGFGMMAIVTGVQRGFITREQAADRFLTITAFLEKARKYHGVYPHFMNGVTGETVAWFGPKDNGGDLVETAFLFEGLLCARQFFNGSSSEEKLIRKRIDKLWKEVEWDRYRRTPDNPYLLWHWSPDQAWVINHRLIGWNETMITYLLAIMSPKHSVPASMYYSGWASQDDFAADYRSNWGRVHDGERYSNGNTYYGIKLDAAVSDGGPLFFVHYSYMGFDPHALTDRYTNYFENNRNIAEINRRYCMENPCGHKGYGSDCWGLTASDHIWNYCASEPASDLDDGTIAPTGALASFPYTPEASMAALKKYYREYGSFLWGEYGFRDAFNLDQNWCSPIFMGLNQAPVTVMIENWRTGSIWNLFMSHEDVKKGLARLDKETAAAR